MGKYDCEVVVSWYYATKNKYGKSALHVNDIL